MSTEIVTGVVLAAALAGAAIGEMVSQEIQARLDKVPSAVLRLAGRRLPPALRSDLLDEWTAELAEILRGADSMPITRLVVGMRFALGLLIASRGIGRTLASSGELEAPGRDVVAVLREALQPQPLLQPDDLRLSACWLPPLGEAASGLPTEVEGVWYDAVSLGAHRTGLVIASVMLSGAASCGSARVAASAGRFRATVRAYASEGLSPTALMHRLDGEVFAQDAYQGLSGATLVFAVFDADSGSLAYANAGHRSPLLRLPDASVLTLDVCGPSLGTGRWRGHGASVDVPPGSFMAFYTQGLMDRGVGDPGGLLGRAAEGWQLTPGAGGLVDIVRDRFLDGLDSDSARSASSSMALMVAQVPQDVPADVVPFRTAEIDLANGSGITASVRSYAAAVMTDWDLSPRLTAVASDAAAELADTACAHGTPPVHLRLRCTDRDLIIDVSSQNQRPKPEGKAAWYRHFDL